MSEASIVPDCGQIGHDLTSSDDQTIDDIADPHSLDSAFERLRNDMSLKAYALASMLELAIATYDAETKKSILNEAVDKLDFVKGYCDGLITISKMAKLSDEKSDLAFFSEFLGHQTNNYLQTAMASIELVGMREHDHPSVNGYLKRSNKAINDVKYLCRAVKEPVCGAFDLGEMVHELKDKYGSQVVSYAAGEEFKVYGFRNFMKESFINIIDNALEAGSDTIEFYISKDHDNVLLHIQDDGEGISEQKIKKFFEPSEGSDKKNGKGYGNHIVHEVITHQHNGNVDVANNAQGARYSIAIPLHKENAAAVA